MNNNFDEINKDGLAEENNEPKVEDTPSVTYDYSENGEAADGMYSMKREDIVKDDLTPSAPDYNTTVTDGEGSIDYTPAESDKNKKKSGKT